MRRTPLLEPIDLTWFRGLFRVLPVCRSDLLRWERTLRHAAKGLTDADRLTNPNEHLDRLTDPDEDPDRRHHRTAQRRRTADRRRLLAVAAEIHRHMISHPDLGTIRERHTDELGEFVP